MKMIRKYVVLLKENDDNQLWLGYNILGKIATRNYKEAFRFDTELLAKNHMRTCQRTLPYPNAKVLCVLEETNEKLTNIY